MNYTTPRDKTCPDCGRTFAAYSPKQKRCTACQARVTREKRRAIMHNYAMRHSTATHEERKCRRCGKAFVSTHKNHHYCSTACQIEAKQGAKHVQRRCRRCGKPFITSMANQKYCTHECMVKWHRMIVRNTRRLLREIDKMERERAVAKKIASLQRHVRIEQGRAVARKDGKRTTASAPAVKVEAWQERVARELQIPDPDARFAAAQKWTPKERKYAQKLAMRGMGWRGPAYGI